MTRVRDDHERGVHHVWARGNGRQATFLRTADRHIYLSLLGKCVERVFRLASKAAQSPFHDPLKLFGRGTVPVVP